MMQSTSTAYAIVAVLVLATSPVVLAQSNAATKNEIKRGEYLVGYGGCHDCHTPKIMSPNGPAPDSSRLLSGHPANVVLPPIPQGTLGEGGSKWVAMTNGDLTAWAGPWGMSFAA